MAYVLNKKNGAVYVKTKGNMQSGVMVDITDKQAAEMLATGRTVVVASVEAGKAVPESDTLAGVEGSRPQASAATLTSLSLENLTQKDVQGMDEATARLFARTHLKLDFPETMRVETILRHVWEKAVLVQARLRENQAAAEG